ncbi:MAG TPA: ABC transporter permease [Planctomycetota bacterium]|nr:ABC transporter permease [Planctomycetota bacterium]
MSLFRIVFKNLRQRTLSSALTSLSIALGVAVVVAILTVKEQSQAAFAQSAFGYDLIVGAKGSELQLVLNTVYHLEKSPGNIPYGLYKELAADKRVKMAVPVAVGDSYHGFRLVGTSDRFLKEFEVLPGRSFELSAGRVFDFSEDRLDHVMNAPPDHDHGAHEMPFEAVVGSAAAAATGLGAGSTFVASHGIDEGPGVTAHEEKWTVTGVLRPTGTPNDRAIFINLESFFAIKGHPKPGQEGRGPEISAIIVKSKGNLAARDLVYTLGRRTDAMGVLPGAVVGRLFEWFGNVNALLIAVSILVIVVGGVSILVSIYNSMSERRRPIAILRALGARRSTILAIILMEATTLCLIGGLSGVVGGHFLAEAAGRVLRSQAGLSITGWAFHPLEGAVIGSLLILGILVGLLPALKAYRSDISKGLNPS